jgi:iron complex transport system substrate-binding protein
MSMTNGSSPHRRLTGLKRRSGAALLVVAVLAAGCGEQTTGDGSPAPQPASSAVTIVDDAGAEVTLDEPATKVVSLAPSQTEMVFAVGGGDELVGVSDYCDYPAAAADVEKIGDFSNPNVEKIVALSPDVVVAAAGVQAEVVSRLAELGVPVVTLEPTTLDDLFTDLEQLGALLGTTDKAAALVADLKAQVADVEEKVKDAPAQTVFFEIYGKPLMTAGSGTLIEDLVARAGGENIGSAAGDYYPEFSEEVLLQQDPEVYIAVKGSQSDPGAIAERPGYDALQAVRNDRVYVIDDDLVVRSGPRAVLGLQEIAAFLHPEAFPEQ